MTNSIIFEQPLNEKCRTLLRLSHLFEQLDYHLPQDTEWHARAALQTLLDISNVLSRADIKSELLKEMDRYSMALSKMADLPHVDSDRLQHILQDLEHSQRTIRNHQGQLAGSLRKSDFLNSVLQRSSIPGGGFDFDLPQLHYWLQQPHSERLLQFDDWRSEITAVQEAVDLLLNLIRHSTTFQPQTALGGFYQQGLGDASAQLVRVSVAEEERVYAEISGGKHRFSVRFMNLDDLEQPSQCVRDIPFDLNVCLL